MQMMMMMERRPLQRCMLLLKCAATFGQTAAGERKKIFPMCKQTIQPVLRRRDVPNNSIEGSFVVHRLEQNARVGMMIFSIRIGAFVNVA
ncbi:hypothetical protein ZHAS_00003199 [Anopheles sinensis]|uniref:Uncharacterized protein n=1 Tax=Anopheles sinensis TaxID=74873 RepID=A0A084VDV3_ANOSI|nr:hypothetical protein ZHAS_00003199 [Anopheles sinensis]